jgi:Vi polysaccharide biosynthesis protein TviE
VLIAALAALVAQVPRIVISVRGMPPNLRQNLSKDEFFGMYLALLQVPGVTVTSNSQAAADAYVDWLGLEKSEIQVIHNASEPRNSPPDEDEIRQWEDFEKRTIGSRQTLGGVFRFDANKRPLLWLDFANAALRNYPDMRFVLVGEGTLFDATQRQATKLGLADRILFTGHSRHVEFWFSKMDAVLLLSEFEGLPNVLIEAQLAGLPVISTPAGGALETFLPQKTGLALDSAKHPTIENFLELLDQLFCDPLRSKVMGALALAQAKEKFSLDSILDQTICHFKGRPFDRNSSPLADPLSLTA